MCSMAIAEISSIGSTTPCYARVYVTVCVCVVVVKCSVYGIRIHTYSYTHTHRQTLTHIRTHTRTYLGVRGSRGNKTDGVGGDGAGVLVDVNAVALAVGDVDLHAYRYT